VGFHNPVTLVPWAKKLMSQDKYDWVSVSLGATSNILHCVRGCTTKERKHLGQGAASGSSCMSRLGGCGNQLQAAS
jgi:hypothetical protein